MTDEDAREILNRIAEKLIAEAIAPPPAPNRLTAMTFRSGRFEVVEIDDNGLIVEPPPRCWRCGIVLCAEHAAMVR